MLPEEQRADLRVHLADWVVSHPYFAEAAVNRFWSYFFGRGFVNPVDDFRSTNPPTHPELLRVLAQDFVQNGYDLKHLMRTIVRSKTYQLSSEPNETNKNDQINYSHATSRLLDAALLFDAISYVTGVPMGFRAGQIQTRKTAERVPSDPCGGCPDIYRIRVLEVYGQTMRAMLPEGTPKPNLGQALHQLVGTTFTDKIAHDAGRIHRFIASGASDREIIERLYLLSLTRFPTAEEESELLTMISEHSSRRQALEDLLWALLSSREFSNNH